MQRKDILGRLLLSILFAGILFKALSVGAATPTRYTQTQLELLVEVKKRTLELVEDQKKEGERLRRCFAFPTLCPSDIAPKLGTIRQAIRQRSEEYRLLAGLARASTTIHGVPSLKLSLALPSITLGSQTVAENPSELKIIKDVYNRDIQEIKSQSQGKLRAPPAPGSFPLNPYVTQESYYMPEDLKTAESFYEMQALMIANQLPFVVYLDSDRHSDADIAKALGKYVRRIQEALNDLYDEETNPLETFLYYEPIVRSIVDENPQTESTFKELFVLQKPKIGFKAWVAKNSPSLRLAAFSTCSLVAAMLQSWPVSLACGGAVAALTSVQLYDDYYRMREDFALWLVGAQSFQALRNSEARIMYTTFIMFLAGQAVGTTLLSIETGIVATLSAIPATTSARLTSLTALREGGLRFASSTISWKGKDLGASLLAQNYVDMTDEQLATTRQDRIFTYSDYLKLNKMTAASKP